MKILYFAWLRERIGHGEAEIAPPPSVVTIAHLMAYLATLSAAHARAFADPRAIKTALDQQFAPPETELGAAREIAFFPPFTGG